MSEKQSVYNAGGVTPASLDAFKIRPCALPFSHPDYTPPTPVEVDALIKLAGWSQNQAAKLVGVSYNPKKGSSTIRKWRAPPDSDDAREIPYSAWRHLLACAGVVMIDDDLLAIEN